MTAIALLFGFVLGARAEGGAEAAPTAAEAAPAATTTAPPAGEEAGRAPAEEGPGDPRLLSVTPPPPAPAAPGSLWNEAQARVLIGMDGNARRVGDLITVNISEQTVTELLASTDAARSSTVSGGIGSLFGIASGAAKANADLGGELGFSVESGSEYAGDGTTRREGTLVGTITCQVVEVLPNNNLVIYGWKRIRVNRETQYLVLQGTVRPRDIRADNTVDSRLIAEARIEVSGAGPVADKQGPGIGQRVLDHAWPF